MAKRDTNRTHCPRHAAPLEIVSVTDATVAFRCNRGRCRSRVEIPRCWANVTQDGRGEWRVAS